MGWRERLQPASFRGVPFHVERSDVAFGRRTAIHEYVDRDGAVVEDLGASAREFSVTCYVVGDDHDINANRLQQVLEEAKSGDLVHPWMGRHFVRPLNGRRREGVRDLNITVFEVTFVEVADRAPGPTDDPAKRLELAADSTRSAAAAGLEDTVELDGVPAFVRDAAGDGLDVVAGVFDVLHYAQDLTSDVTIAARRVNALTSSVAALLTAPADLAAAVLAAMDSIRATAATSIDGFYAYDAFFGIDAPARAGRSRLADIATANARAVVDCARAGALYGAAMEAAAADWPSAAAFLAAQVRLDEEFDALEDRAGDALYVALRELRARMVRAFDGVQPRIRRERRFTLTATTPAIVLAYRIFGDVEREPDVLSSTRASDPLRIPGGVELSVLVDE